MPEPEGGGRGISPVILSVVATLIVVGAAAWAASALGIIRVEFLPKQGVLGGAAAGLQSLPGASSAVRPHATLDGLPDIVANMPAVIALKMADPDAYGRFAKRFTAVYHDNEPDDVILTQARTALRKSIKHLLANATNESLLEVTEVNLAYMRGLAPSNAGSCVALSDESKGAMLDSILARDFPPLFEREMAVLERVIANVRNEAGRADGGGRAAVSRGGVRRPQEEAGADAAARPRQAHRSRNTPPIAISSSPSTRGCGRCPSTTPSSSCATSTPPRPPTGQVVELIAKAVIARLDRAIRNPAPSVLPRLCPIEVRWLARSSRAMTTWNVRSADLRVRLLAAMERREAVAVRHLHLGQGLRIERVASRRSPR